jgi:hypothetical protein
MGPGNPPHTRPATNKWWGGFLLRRRTHITSPIGCTACPVIPKDSLILWKEAWTANPATLHFKRRHLLYYRGHGRTAANPEGHDCLAVAEIMSVTASEFNFRGVDEKHFIVDAGPRGTFDDPDVLDPSTI